MKGCFSGLVMRMMRMMNAMKACSLQHGRRQNGSFPSLTMPIADNGDNHDDDDDDDDDQEVEHDYRNMVAKGESCLPKPSSKAHTIIQRRRRRR
jgi:hypothetical protein